MKVLIVGAYGQVGQELFRSLAGRIGAQNIVCNDIREPPSHLGVKNHQSFDILEKDKLYEVIQK